MFDKVDHIIIKFNESFVTSKNLFVQADKTNNLYEKIIYCLLKTVDVKVSVFVVKLMETSDKMYCESVFTSTWFEVFSVKSGCESNRLKFNLV